MECVLHHAVDADLVRSAQYIRRDNPNAAARFLDRAFEAFDFIGRWPEASPLARLPAKRHRGIRFRPLPRPFHNYVVFYQIRGGRGAYLPGPARRNQWAG